MKLTRAEMDAVAAIEAAAAEIRRVTGRHGLTGIEIAAGRGLDRLDAGTVRTSAGNVTITVVGRPRAQWAAEWRIPTASERRAVRS